MKLFRSDSRSTVPFTPALLLGTAIALGAGPGARAQNSTPSPGSPLSPPSTMAAPTTPVAAAGAIAPNRTTTSDVAAAFDRGDTNKDGRLSREEAEKFPEIANRFDQIDANKDGFLSRDEFIRGAGL